MQNIMNAIKTKGWGPTGHGPPPTDDLTPATRDSLFLFQLQLSDPTALTEGSLLLANICETSQYAHSVFKSLTKSGVIEASTGHPDTTKISKNLVNQIAIISVPKQREVVNLLFFWEEELMRWRVLDAEVTDIRASIAAQPKGDERVEMRERLRVLEAMKKVVPSLRREDGTLKSVEGNPPAYAG